MTDENDSKYTVGYSKPPQHTRFKKGQSGNPKGRPRKTATFDDDVETELRSVVVVREGDKIRKMTKRRAMAKQHVNKAVGGDVRSTELVLNNRRQGRFNEPDNLGALLEEFRESNRRQSADVPEDDTSIGLADNRSSIHSAGEKS